MSRDILNDVHTTGTRYLRDEAYVHWRRANELAGSHTLDDLIDELATLEATQEPFQERFDAATPSGVTLPLGATHADIEARLETLSEWATVRDAIARHTEAIRIARRSDGRLTA